MNIFEEYKKIDEVEQILLKMQKLAHIPDNFIDQDPDEAVSTISGGEEMSTVLPTQNGELHKLWGELQKKVPAGFDIDGNLIRHLSFNEAHDWLDIYNHDIPRELVKIDRYRKKLGLIEYMNFLHPEVNRVSSIVLNGDIDAALKTVFASLDTKIRQEIECKPSESTVPAIGKAFNDGKLIAPQPENKESVRNFLQGVIGYYRSNIVHNPLPFERNSVEASMSLFALAHEAFKLIDACSIKF